MHPALLQVMALNVHACTVTIFLLPILNENTRVRVGVEIILTSRTEMVIGRSLVCLVRLVMRGGSRGGLVCVVFVRCVYQGYLLNMNRFCVLATT